MDKSTAVGICGAVTTFLAPYIDVLELLGQSLAGIGGLVLCYLMIYHKIIQIRKDSKDEEIK